jgi:hypothetical protein
MKNPKFRITARKPGAIQYSVETRDSAEAMASWVTELAGLGWKVELVEQFEAHKDPDNVRFDYETGAAIQYEDADDASEHHLRMMGG